MWVVHFVVFFSKQKRDSLYPILEFLSLHFSMEYSVCTFPIKLCSPHQGTRGARGRVKKLSHAALTVPLVTFYIWVIEKREDYSTLANYSGWKANVEASIALPLGSTYKMWACHFVYNGPFRAANEPSCSRVAWNSARLELVQAWLVT